MKLAKLRQALLDNGVDALLITNDYNRRYMTGFTGTAGVAIVSQNDAVFITDFRYTEQAVAQITDFRIVQHKGTIFEEVGNQVALMGIKTLGFEKDALLYGMYEVYNKAVKVDFVPLSGLIEKIRLIKTTEEINIIK
ncbi:MAG: aminopeptidase P family N-terminal domain-containing protein, partial [Solibacillus sp.]